MLGAGVVAPSTLASLIECDGKEIRCPPGLTPGLTDLIIVASLWTNLCTVIPANCSEQVAWLMLAYTPTATSDRNPRTRRSHVCEYNLQLWQSLVSVSEQCCDNCF
jgi:hypothetical protein